MTMGVELETYSILIPNNRVCRDLQFPRRSAVEKGERFTRDWSIGSEYNSKVFSTAQEALFLLKSGLRKYAKFRDAQSGDDHYAIFPVGGWIDRFAGCHIHMALGNLPFEYEDAKKLATCLHDHIPFLIVLLANSPVWRQKLTDYASNRLFLASEKYCRITRRGILYKHPYRELSYNRGGSKKPPTLELRVGDSSLPEPVVAALCVCSAVAERWLRGKPPLNRCTHETFLKARDLAVRRGAEAKLAWNNHWISVPHYVDLFFRKYEDELKAMDIPDVVTRIFKYLKKGWNQSTIIRQAVLKCQRRHPPTWERQFAKRYRVAIEENLDGNTFGRFAQRLGVRLPNIERTWLGRKEAKW